MKAKREGFVFCSTRFLVPNGVNILNKVKEVMKNYGMYYNTLIF